MITRPPGAAAVAPRSGGIGLRRGRRPIVHRLARPELLLVALCAASFGARVAWLGAPCRGQCRSAGDHVLVFDERYYVNAARVIAGVHPPRGAPYADDPLGVDPNAEQPPLVKLIIAGSIEIFGDGPLAWRLGSVVAGTLALVAMFALVRAAGGARWVAFSAAALMAFDNLMLVHGRIGTLDIYALAAMVWAAAVYLRGSPLLAGALIGVGICAKPVAAYLVIALVAYEGLFWLRERDRPLPRIGRVCASTAAAGAVFVGLMALLGQFAPPYDDGAHQLVSGGTFGEIAHIISYAAAQTSPHGPAGIASYPWGWLVDYKPIVYLNINPAHPAPGLYDIHPAVHFLGLISPPILLLALPALVIAAMHVTRWPAGPGFALPALAIAWFAGTFVPFVLLSLVLARTSYLYYMVVVMPSMYMATAWMLPRLWHRRRPIAAWIMAVVVAAVICYPLTPLP